MTGGNPGEALVSFSNVVQAIYAAAHSPHLWEQALEAIARYTDVCQVVLGQVFLKDRVKTAAVYRDYERVDRELVERLLRVEHADFMGRDTVAEKMMGQPEGTVMVTHHPDLPDAPSDAYYQFLKQIYPYIAGVNLLLDEERINGMGLCRVAEQAPFSEADLDKVRLLVPHMQQAVRINEALYHVRAQEEALGRGLDLLTVGVVLFDHMGNRVWNNPMARSLLRTHPAIRMHNNQVLAHDPEQSAELRRMIASVLGTFANDGDEVPALGLVHPERPFPLVAFVHRLGDQDMELDDGEEELVPRRFAGTFAALYLSDPGWEQPVDNKLIAKVFDLSRSEAAVTVLLANGLTVPEIARTQSLSEHTVRTHLRNIYPKLGVTRQPELVRVVLNGVGALRA